MKCLSTTGRNNQHEAQSSSSRFTAGVSKKAAVLAGVLLSCIATSTFSAKPVFTQRDANGRMIFSDAPLINGKMVRTSYQSEFGRPVAKSSCIGLSTQKMAERAKSYEQAFVAAADVHNLDADLIRAVAQVESCFDQNAVSRVGAQGVMQLMPNTAAELGVTDSFNAVQNIHGGANYLAKMMSRFNNNHQYALAAYNAGPGAVEKHNGIPPYPETQDYVKKVLDIYTTKP